MHDIRFSALFLTLFLINSNSFSQISEPDDKSFSVGSSISLRKEESYPTDVIHTEETTYLIASRKSKYAGGKPNLWIFNPSSLQMEEKVEPNLEVDGEKNFYLTHFELSGNLYLVSGNNDRKQGVRKIYSHKLDKEGKIESSKLIAEIGLGGVKNIYGKRGRALIIARELSFHVLKSPDQKSIGFFFPNDFKDGNNTWSLRVYDSTFQLTKSEEFAIQEEGVHLKDAVLTNDHDVFALGLCDFSLLKHDIALLSSSPFESLYPVGSSYILYHFNSELKSTNSTDLMLTENDVLCSKLAIIDDEVLCYGYAGEVKSGLLNANVNIRARGCFFVKSNLQGEVEFNQYYDFNEGWYKYTFHPENVVLKKSDLNRRREDFLLGDVFKNDQGDYMILAEKYQYLYIHSSSSAMGGRATVDNSSENFIYGDIAVISLSNDGDLNWMRRFNKHESYGKETSFVSSYHASLTDNKLSLFINDFLYWTDKDKFDSLGKSEVEEASKQSVLSEIIIDEKGESQRNAVITFGDNQEERVSCKSLRVSEDGDLLFFTRFLGGSKLALRHHYIRMGKKVY